MIMSAAIIATVIIAAVIIAAVAASSYHSVICGGYCVTLSSLQHYITQLNNFYLQHPFLTPPLSLPCSLLLADPNSGENSWDVELW